MMAETDLISRQAAIDALNGIINRFEQILRDIRESKVDDSVCGMCEYDGAFVGQSGDWCNECPLNKGNHRIWDFRCKATCHYNRRTREWEFDVQIKGVDDE